MACALGSLGWISHSSAWAGLVSEGRPDMVRSICAKVMRASYGSRRGSRMIESGQAWPRIASLAVAERSLGQNTSLTWDLGLGRVWP